ncbi:hypothetical protein AX16_009916 [Volvariella volvacea WC 439]|nr:hypothetical protein AX16_009916 [Volvariella volvacea WC 439]
MARTLRVPQIDLQAILAEPNPRIDLRIDVYETSTRNFLKAISNYKNRAIATITDRRSRQADEKKRILDKIAAYETEINQCKLREIELVAELEREKEERKDAEQAVAALKRQLASLRDKSASIQTEIEQYRAITDNMGRERNKERATLDTHASRVFPELEACQKALSCIVEGVEKDQLLIRFYRVDLSDPQREFSFVIDVSQDTYKVITSSPVLPVMAILVDELNTTQDLYHFIKQVRAGYQELVQAGR